MAFDALVIYKADLMVQPSQKPNLTEGKRKKLHVAVDWNEI